MERRIVAQMLTCMDDLGGPLPGAAAEAHPGDLPRAAGNDADEPAAAAPHKHVIVIGVALLLSGRHYGVVWTGLPIRCAGNSTCLMRVSTLAGCESVLAFVRTFFVVGARPHGR